MKNNITNEQIIQSARRQRQTVNNRIDVEPWQSHHRKDRGMAVAIAVAASLISFIAGYGLQDYIPRWPNPTSSRWRRPFRCSTTPLCI